MPDHNLDYIATGVLIEELRKRLESMRDHARQTRMDYALGKLVWVRDALTVQELEYTPQPKQPPKEPWTSDRPVPPGYPGGTPVND